MGDDPYAGFADRYDWFFGSEEPDPDALEFFRRLFAQDGVKRVLDCACGTGRDLRLFHALGCETHGCDISPSMLAVAQENLERWGIQIPVQHADYRELPQHFSGAFDAVMCLSTSISHMSDEAEILKAFKSVRAVLRPGGILVLTQGTTDCQWKKKPRFVLAQDRPEFSRLFVIDYHGRGARYNVLDIVRHEGASELKTWSTDYAILLLQADHSRLLAAAGFSSVEFFGSFAFDPYDSECSTKLIVIAKK